MAARNERGTEQLPDESSSTSLAHMKRGISERKWVEACSCMDGIALEQVPHVPTTEEDAARPNADES